MTQPAFAGFLFCRGDSAAKLSSYPAFLIKQSVYRCNTWLYTNFVMSEEEIIGTAQEAIYVAIIIGTPLMLIGLFVGVLIALLQSLTQIQEITLVFVPKIIAIYVSLALMLPWMAQTLVNFMNELADRIVGLG